MNNNPLKFPLYICDSFFVILTYKTEVISIDTILKSIFLLIKQIPFHNDQERFCYRHLKEKKTLIYKKHL